MATQRTFEIMNRLGLHARAASKLVHLASRYPCDVHVEKDGRSVNGKSVMGLLLLCGAKGTSVTIRAEGEREGEVVDAIGELIAGRFGEPE